MIKKAEESTAIRAQYITNVAPVKETVNIIDPVGSPLKTVIDFDYPASTVIGVPIL